MRRLQRCTNRLGESVGVRMHRWQLVCLLLAIPAWCVPGLRGKRLLDYSQLLEDQRPVLPRFLAQTASQDESAASVSARVAASLARLKLGMQDELDGREAVEVSERGVESKRVKVQAFRDSVGASSPSAASS